MRITTSRIVGAIALPAVAAAVIIGGATPTPHVPEQPKKPYYVDKHGYYGNNKRNYY